MRKKGWLKVPAVTFLTDFAVHPLWVHPDIDAHVATSTFAAETATDRGGKDARASGPLVSERFSDESGFSRAATRRAFGIGPDDRAVLVVAGSWGVGDVVGTVEAIGRAGDYHPVTVCGRDQGAEGHARGARPRHGHRLDRRDARADGGVRRDGRERGRAHRERGVRRRAAGHHVQADCRTRQGQRRGHGRDRRVPVRAHRGRAARSRSRTSPNPVPRATSRSARAAALFAGDAKTDVLELAEHRDREQVVEPVRDPKAQRRLTGVLGVIVLLYVGLTARRPGRLRVRRRCRPRPEGRARRRSSSACGSRTRS